MKKSDERRQQLRAAECDAAEARLRLLFGPPPAPLPTAKPPRWWSPMADREGSPPPPTGVDDRVSG